MREIQDTGKLPHSDYDLSSKPVQQDMSVASFVFCLVWFPMKTPDPAITMLGSAGASGTSSPSSIAFLPSRLVRGRDCTQSKPCLHRIHWNGSPLECLFRFTCKLIKMKFNVKFHSLVTGNKLLVSGSHSYWVA